MELTITAESTSPVYSIPYTYKHELRSFQGPDVHMYDLSTPFHIPRATRVTLFQNNDAIFEGKPVGDDYWIFNEKPIPYVMIEPPCTCSVIRVVSPLTSTYAPALVLNLTPTVYNIPVDANGRATRRFTLPFQINETKSNVLLYSCSTNGCMWKYCA
jgi:hypothetical protein